MLAHGQADVFGFHIEVEAVVAAVAADAAGFDTAEGGGQVAHVVGVDPDHAGFDVVGHAQGAAYVLCPDVGGEAVFDVVGDGQGFVFALEGDGGEEGAEDFFLGDAHVGGGIDEKDGVDVSAVG